MTYKALVWVVTDLAKAPSTTARAPGSNSCLDTFVWVVKSLCHHSPSTRKKKPQKKLIYGHKTTCTRKSTRTSYSILGTLKLLFMCIISIAHEGTSSVQYVLASLFESHNKRVLQILYIRPSHQLPRRVTSVAALESAVFVERFKEML